MKQVTRRQFVKTSSAAIIAAAAFPSFDFINPKPLLSFSTLGCPEWTFDEILSFAVENNYDGIEIRGILKQMDLTQCPEFSTKENIAVSKRKVAEKNLKIVNLGASANLHQTVPAERQKNLDEAKRFIDLAQQLGSPYIRVFPNELPNDDTRKTVRDLIISGLQELGNHAKGTGVTVLMETHGNVVKADELKLIMDTAAHPQVGLVWDPINMWSVTKENPSYMYQQLKPYIRHTHIKDAKIVGDKLNYVLLGKGDTPILQAMDILYKDKYKGYYSFEWEKLWHPEIAAPEIALADYPRAARARLK